MHRRCASNGQTTAADVACMVSTVQFQLARAAHMASWPLLAYVIWLPTCCAASSAAARGPKLSSTTPAKESSLSCLLSLLHSLQVCIRGLMMARSEPAHLKPSTAVFDASVKAYCWHRGSGAVDTTTRTSCILGHTQLSKWKEKADWSHVDGAHWPAKLSETSCSSNLNEQCCEDSFVHVGHQTPPETVWVHKHPCKH